MKCPFCNSAVITDQLGTDECTYQCANYKPSLIDYDCPLRTQWLTAAQITQMEVALIDLEME